MSCYLFNIHVDDMLVGVNNNASQEGIRISASCTVAGQNYADDFTGLSHSPSGLQRIIELVRCHSLLWRWPVNVKKSNVLVFNPKGTGPDVKTLRWTWGDAQLSQVTRTKLLGIMLTANCSWTAQVEDATKKGWGKYHTWRRVLSQP